MNGSLGRLSIKISHQLCSAQTPAKRFESKCAQDSQLGLKQEVGKSRNRTFEFFRIRIKSGLHNQSFDRVQPIKTLHCNI
jgi:hypothetical protein